MTPILSWNPVGSRAHQTIDCYIPIMVGYLVTAALGEWGSGLEAHSLWVHGYWSKNRLHWSCQELKNNCWGIIWNLYDSIAPVLSFFSVAIYKLLVIYFHLQIKTGIWCKGEQETLWVDQVSPKRVRWRHYRSSKLMLFTEFFTQWIWGGRPRETEGGHWHICALLCWLLSGYLHSG